MKIIIAGSRNITDINIVKTAIKNSNFKITEIVSGGAKGIDKVGEMIAKEWGIPLKTFPANWNLYGNFAGPVRNKQMADYADGLIAIWDGQSRGTKNMIDKAKLKKLPIFIALQNH